MLPELSNVNDGSALAHLQVASAISKSISRIYPLEQEFFRSTTNNLPSIEDVTRGLNLQLLRVSRHELIRVEFRLVGR